MVIKIDWRQLSSYILILALVALPLVFDIRTLNVFDVTKVTFFNLAVIVATVFYLSGVFKNWQLYREDLVRFFSSRINQLIIAIFIVQLVASYFSVFRLTSVWGIYERWLGLFTLTHVFVFYYLAHSLFNRTTIKLLLLGLSIVVFITSSYAIFQHFGIDLPGFARGFRVATTDYSLRSFATLGHPNFLAGFLILNIPLVIYLLLTSIKLNAKSFFGTTLFLSILAIIFTLSRSAWVTVLLTALICLAVLWKKFHWSFKHIKNKKIIFVIAIAAIILLVVGIPSALPRLTSFNISGDSLGVRLWLWQIAVEAWKSKVLLGFGPENFYTISQNFPSPFAIEENLFDRTHNIFIDSLINGGILLLLAQLSLLFFWIKFLFKAIKDSSIKDDVLFYCCLLAASLGYIIFGFFNFDSIVSLTFIYTLVAISLKWGEVGDKKFIFSKASIIFVFLGALILYAPIWHSINIWRADLFAKQADTYFRDGAIVKAENELQNSINLNNKEFNYFSALAKVQLAKALTSGESQQLWTSVESYNKARALGLPDPVYYREMITVFRYWSQVDSNQIPVLLDLYNRGEMSLGGDANFYLGWGEVYYSLGNKSEAEIKLRKYLFLNRGQYPLEYETIFKNLKIIN